MRVVGSPLSSRILLATGAMALGMSVGIVGISAGGRASDAPMAAGRAAPAPVATLSLGPDVGGVDLGAALDRSVDAAQVPASAVRARPGLARLLVGKTERAEITIATAAGTKTILYVRAEIASISTTAITMKLSDGTRQAFAIDTQTFVREKGKQIKPTDLRTGDRAMVFGLKNADGSFTARLIRCIREQARPAASPSGS